MLPINAGSRRGFCNTSAAEISASDGLVLHPPAFSTPPYRGSVVVVMLAVVAVVTVIAVPVMPAVTIPADLIDESED
jgi:hypothetical protein